jgi:hypothetical protein
MQVQDVSEHAHQWKRWPVINFSFDYQCAVCGEPESIVWVTDHAGKSISDMDDLLVEKRGGVFAGEMCPQQPPVAFSAAWLEITGNGQ